ncbi:MAG: hypothetical protein PHD97_12140 [Bacteroidales bacterium]|nr:hypothetical protein [Bacteroidales bacterium]
MKQILTLIFLFVVFISSGQNRKIKVNYIKPENGEVVFKKTNKKIKPNDIFEINSLPDLKKFGNFVVFKNCQELRVTDLNTGRAESIKPQNSLSRMCASRGGDKLNGDNFKSYFENIYWVLDDSDTINVDDESLPLQNASIFFRYIYLKDTIKNKISVGNKIVFSKKNLFEDTINSMNVDSIVIYYQKNGTTKINQGLYTLPVKIVFLKDYITTLDLCELTNDDFANHLFENVVAKTYLMSKYNLKSDKSVILWIEDKKYQYCK